MLRGIEILKEKYRECMEKQVPGIVKVALMGQAYYQFSQEYPDYLRLIHFYGSERFSKENPYTAEIGKGYGTCRMILRDAIREGIGDGTIRADLDPFLTSMYLMISFMGILSMENKWKLVIEAEGFSYEQFTSEFFRFIIPAISSGEKSHKWMSGILNPFGFFLTEPVEPEKEKEKKILIFLEFWIGIFFTSVPHGSLIPVSRRNPSFIYSLRTHPAQSSPPNRAYWGFTAPRKMPGLP